MIEASNLGPVKKTLLKGLVTNAAKDPAKVKAVLERIRAALGQ